MDSKIIKIIIFFFITSISAKAVEFNGKFIQGHFILGKADINSKVFIDEKEVKVSKEGFFAFGLDRDRKYDVTIEIKKDGKTEKLIKKVQKRKYNIQRIDGLEEKKLHLPRKFMRELKMKISL